MELKKLYLLDVNIFEDQEVYAQAYAGMDAGRRKKIDAYRFDKDKRLSLGAGFLLQKALGDIGISEYEIGYGKREKPYLIGHENIFFNLSHSGNMAAFGISDREIGVDIEKEKEFRPTLINYVFNDGDKELAKELIKSIGLSDEQVYTRLWTVKESIMKYTGIGIGLEPKKIELYGKLDAGEYPVIYARSSEYDFEKLKLTCIDLDGYQLTVCSEYEGFKIETGNPTT